MKFTKGQVVTFASVVIGVVLTAIIHLGIRAWFQPDLRYEEGQWYHSGDLSLTSLKLTNYGHATADNVIITASFQQKIKEVSTSDGAFPFKVTFGGTGQTSVSGTIPRLVPGQTLYAYFAIESAPRTVRDQSFVDSLIHNDGKAKTGVPEYSLYYLAGLTLLTCTMSLILSIKSRRERLAFDAQLGTILKRRESRGRDPA